MSAIPPAARQGAIQKLLTKMKLRFPGLFVLLLVVTVVDFLVPDLIPFADEIVLALLTLLFGLWKDRRLVTVPRQPPQPPPPAPPSGPALPPGAPGR